MARGRYTWRGPRREKQVLEWSDSGVQSVLKSVEGAAQIEAITEGMADELKAKYDYSAYVENMIGRERRFSRLVIPKYEKDRKQNIDAMLNMFEKRSD